MALSGSFYTSVGSFWRLQLEWSASQSQENNTSTVKANLYWMTTSGYGAVYSDAPKKASLYINGTWNEKPATSDLAGLKPNQKKLIHSYTKVINHDAEGNASVTFDGWFDAEVTLEDVKYNRISLAAKTYSLNQISRESSLTSSPSWKAGSNANITISRNSTAYRHEVIFYVKNKANDWVSIKRIYVPASDTYASTEFDIDDVTLIYRTLAQRSSAETQVILQTYKGTNTLIGTKWYYGTVTAPKNSTTTFTKDFSIGGTIKGKITEHNPNFYHTIELTFGTNTWKILDKSTTLDWSYDTSSIASILYTKIPNLNSLDGTIRIYTYYYNDVQVGDYVQAKITASVANSNPIFTKDQFVYADINAPSIAVTGNDQVIIQGYSSLRVTLNSFATPQNGATMKHYQILVNGVTKTITTLGWVNFGKINADKNIVLEVRAVDSRGLITKVTKTITVVPYSLPQVSIIAKRTNSFNTSTTISAVGYISPIEVSKVKKNIVQSVQLRTRKKGSTTWSPYTNFVVTPAGVDYSTDVITVDLDNLYAWDVEVSITDKLNTIIKTKRVEVGRPLFYIDSGMESVGINDLPQNPNELRVNARVVFGANRWASKGTAAQDLAGVMDLSNSDVFGLNGLFFADWADNNGEGLMFPKLNTPQNSTDILQYDNFRIKDGTAFMNGKPVFTSDNEILWGDNALFLTQAQFAYPSKMLSDCPNGWILVWSRFVNGAKSNTNWNISVVPKTYPKISGGWGMWCPLIATGADDTTTAPPMAYKYIYPTEATISGHDRNGVGTQSGQVLRYVLSF